MRDKAVYDEVARLRATERSRQVSLPALELHVRATACSVRTDCPVYVTDEMLDGIASGQVSTMAALELTLSGLWDRAQGGYVISDLGLVERLGTGVLRRNLASALRRSWRALNRDNFIPL